MNGRNSCVLPTGMRGPSREIAEWLGPKLSDPELRPFAVIMKSTDVCQYYCVYCYVEPQHRQPIMPIGTAKTALRKVFEYVPAERKINLIWHGGEPLLAGLGFFEAIADFCDSFDGRLIENCLQTNGALLDDAVLRFCRDRGFLVSVSIDGPEAIHDENRVTRRGYGTFARTMEAIARMRALGMSTGCVCVLSRANVERIEELYRFFRDERIHFRINPVVRSGRAVTSYNTLAIAPGEYGWAMCRLFDLWFDDPDPIQVEPLQTILGNFVAPTLWGCDYQGRCLESIISVNPDGSVYPCGRFAGLTEFKLGNVLDDTGIASMFGTEAAKRLRTRSPRTVPGCTSCEFLSVCNTGCMITAHMARGDINDRDYYCAGRKILFRHMIQRLMEQLQQAAP